jgi:ATP dependent DNA ligase domain
LPSLGGWAAPARAASKENGVLPYREMLFYSGAVLNSHRLPVGFIPPCLPPKAVQPPSGERWLHEIKHDGFRVIARKDGKHVRLYSRPGNDLTDRFALIVDALATTAACSSTPRNQATTLLY